MARNVIEILIKAKDGASAQVKSMGEKIKGSVKKLITLPHVIMAAGVTKAITSVISAYSKQEEAIAKLNAAMRAGGTFTKEATQSLQDYAKALQETTKFGDEEILSAEAMLATFKLTEETIKEIIPLVLDMAAATGQDLQSAAILMGKAAVGVTGTLSRYGVIVDKVDLKNRGLAAVLDEVRKNFGGTAEAVAKAGTGPMKQFANSIGDIAEKFGEELIPNINSAIKSLEEIAPVITTVGKILMSAIGNILSGIASIAALFAKLPAIIAGVATAIALLGRQMIVFLTELSLAQVILLATSAALVSVEEISKRFGKRINEQIDSTDKWNSVLKKIPDYLKAEGAETEKILALLDKERRMREFGTERALEHREKVVSAIGDIINAWDNEIKKEEENAAKRIALSEKELEERKKFEDALYEYKIKIGEITLEQQIADTERSMEILREKNEIETEEFVSLLDRRFELQTEQNEKLKEAEDKKFEASKERAEELNSLYSSVASGMSTNFVSAFKDISAGEKDFAKINKKLMTGILSTVSGVIDKIMAKKIEEAILTKALSTTEAGAKSVSAHAGIPFIGLILGLAAAAAASAAISKFATGGIVTKPTLGLVGEAGPEAIIPLDRMGNMGGIRINNVIIQFPEVTSFNDWLTADPALLKEVTERKIYEAMETLLAEGITVPGI